MNNHLEQTVKALDKFIESIGGNIDARANHNKLRRALLAFLRSISPKTKEEIEDILALIVQEGLTSHSISGEENKAKLEDLENLSKEKYQVYDGLGRRIGIGIDFIQCRKPAGNL